MYYNLTQAQKDVLIWFVAQTKAGKLVEEFDMAWYMDGPDKCRIIGYQGDPDTTVQISRTTITALVAEKLIGLDILYSQKEPGKERRRNYYITAKGYEAVENGFNAPDTSFIKYLTPLSDLTNFDEEIKKRCLPILGAGSVDPVLWDSVVRTAAVILEERLRDVGNITDPNQIGRDLVNKVFGNGGTLAHKFNVPGERDGYRDLYVGLVGVFRNPYGHRFIDPPPERGGVTLMFINLLLQMLEDLR